jgi:hypothetical protein
MCRYSLRACRKINEFATQGPRGRSTGRVVLMTESEGSSIDQIAGVVTARLRSVKSMRERETMRRAEMIQMLAYTSQ